MARRRAAKPRGRSRSHTRTTKRGRTKKRGRSARASGFLNFVRSMRNLFPSHSPAQLKQDATAIWRQMVGEDKVMYATGRSDCGPGGWGRRMGRRRSRSRSRRRGRSRSRSRSRSRRRRQG